MCVVFLGIRNCVCHLLYVESWHGVQGSIISICTQQPKGMGFHDSWCCCDVLTHVLTHTTNTGIVDRGARRAACPLPGGLGCVCACWGCTRTAAHAHPPHTTGQNWQQMECDSTIHSRQNWAAVCPTMATQGRDWVLFLSNTCSSSSHTCITHRLTLI